MKRVLEPPSEALPTPRQLWRALDRHSVSNGVTAWVMACTGPFVVMLSAALAGGMSQQDIGSWVLAGYGLGGVFTVVFSVLYRMPMGMGWTIPGVVLLGGALGHLRFSECVGAFYVSGALITLLGVTGWVERLARYLPLNIVMAMVAGVFLPFVLKIVPGFAADWLVSTLTVGAFVIFSAIPKLAARLPPILVAITCGAAWLAMTGRLTVDELPAEIVVRPIVYVPEFTVRGMLELVVPLTITVVGIHNLQGFAISQANGYAPPRNALTTACGLGSFVFAVIGTVPTCVTGPANGILNASGEKERRYAGAVVFGGLMILFGVFAPLTTALALVLPLSFIGLVGGLAMYEVLRGAFLQAFGGRVSLGALTTFVVTVADQPIANIGAPFWAILFGLAVAYVFERSDLEQRAPLQ